MKTIKIILLFVFCVGVHYGASLFFFGKKYDQNTHVMQWSFPFPVISEIPLWERKVLLTDEELKIGLITDTHLDSKRFIAADGTKLEERYMPQKYVDQLKHFVSDMQFFDPVFIAHLGDVIEGTNVSKDVGIIEIGLVRDEIMKAGIPTYWALGNHDVRSVARRHFRKELDQSGINQVIDHGPYRFILFDANYRNDGTPGTPLSGDYVPGFVPKETMVWLEEQLKTDKHVYLFAHHSFVPVEFTDKNPVANHADVRTLFSRYHVRAVFDGHIEKRFHREIDGVSYYTFPGTKKSPSYRGAYYAMTLRDGVPDISMYYQGEGDQYIQEAFIKEGHMIGDVLKREEEEKAIKTKEELSL